MKKFYFVLLFFFLVISSPAQVFSGIYDGFVVIDSGSGNNYYDLNPSTQTGNFDFNGTNLGTFLPGDVLILNGAEVNTAKCNPDNVLSSALNYRIYEQSSTAPVFSSTNISFDFDNGNANHFDCFPALQQRWTTTSSNIDILNSLPSGDYYLEVFLSSEVDFTFDNISDTTRFYSNSSLNYRASFRVDNPPSAMCQDVTLVLDGTGNATLTTGDVDNGSSDDFDGGSLIYSLDRTAFSCADIGTPVTVTLTVEDSQGQTDTCTAQITVEDNIDPTAVCQDVTIQLDAAGNASVTAAQVDNGSS
uniref:hypothetical protein n=1 Tax=Winogradskyella sp. A3E31 TaxID=3349637 RepID=UPI00398B4A1B